MLSKINIPKNTPDLFSIEKDTTIRTVLIFVNQNLRNFSKHCKDKNITSEILFNHELFIFLEREARLTSSLFLFTQEPKNVRLGKPDLGVVNIERYSDSTAFFTIECKILPTNGTGREKEYVQNEVVKNSGKIWEAGAMARFKKCIHGENLSSSAIIAYIRENDFMYWFKTINNWIKHFVSSSSSLWSSSDFLTSLTITENVSMCISINSRISIISMIKLYHLWVQME